MCYHNPCTYIYNAHFYIVNYLYTQNPTAKKPIILIDQYIGTDAKGNVGIEESQFTREVLSLQNAGITEADVWINSKGGLWSTSVGIVSAMNNSSIKFTTYNMGFADSSAGHIFQAGQKRVWMPQAIGLVHEIQGNGSEHVLEAMNASIATMLCEKTKKSADEVRGLMKANTMMNADMAEQYGFCDEVAKTGAQNILTFTNSSDAYDAGQEQIKKLLPKNKSMEAVNNLLGLTNDANEASQLTAINKIIEARNAAETKLVAVETELSNTKSTLTETNGKLLVAENAILTATNESKRIKAEVLVKEHVGKRIVDTPDNITKWTNLAIADHDGTKALIEAINLNVVAPKVPSADDTAPAPTTAAGFMMEKQKETEWRRNRN